MKYLDHNQVAEVQDFFMYSQSMMSHSMCKEIWPESVDHYWDKWQESRATMVYFWTRLDRGNQMKLVQYYNENAE